MTERPFDPDDTGRCRKDKAGHLHICNAEAAAFEEWKAKHAPACPIKPPEPRPGDPLGIGGFGAASRFSLKLTDTMIGLQVMALCDCGASEHISHMEHT